MKTAIIPSPMKSKPRKLTLPLPGVTVLGLQGVEYVLLVAPGQASAAVRAHLKALDQRAARLAQHNLDAARRRLNNPGNR